MASYFTHYWKNAQWEWERIRIEHGDRPPHLRGWQFVVHDFAPVASKTHKLDHTAGNLFSKSGVSCGDAIFIVTVKKGVLLLGGKIVVARICGHGEAAKILGFKENEIYSAREHVIGAEPSDRFVYDRAVPLRVVEALQFESTEGPKHLVFKELGKLDQQTLRGVRRLTASSAKLLERQIA